LLLAEKDNKIGEIKMEERADKVIAFLLSIAMLLSMLQTFPFIAHAAVAV
jgi:hypothetical protein